MLKLYIIILLFFHSLIVYFNLKNCFFITTNANVPSSGHKQEFVICTPLCTCTILDSTDRIVVHKVIPCFLILSRLSASTSPARLERAVTKYNYFVGWHCQVEELFLYGTMQKIAS